MKARAGFTLIEVLTTLAVLVLLGAMTMPALGVFRSLRLDAAASQVEGAVERTRQRAMTRGVPTAFAILTGGKEQAFLALEATAGDPAAPWQPVGRRERLPAGIRFDTGAAATFFASSTPATLPEVVYEGKTLKPGAGYTAVVFNPDLQAANPLCVRLVGDDASAPRDLLVIPPHGQVLYRRY